MAPVSVALRAAARAACIGRPAGPPASGAACMRLLGASARRLSGAAASRTLEAAEGGAAFEYDAEAVPRAAAAARAGAQPGCVAETPFPEEARCDYSSVAALYPGASSAPFDKTVADVLHAPLDPADVEIKPDGALYLPESRYRRILNRAFGPGGWALVPRGPHVLATLAGGAPTLSREYALFCAGRFVSQARGHGPVPAFSTPALATEVVRSNALMRVCKDLGIANELFDPAFIAAWRAKRAVRRIDNGRVRWYKAELQK